jgi:hypothetical protein
MYLKLNFDKLLQNIILALPASNDVQLMQHQHQLPLALIPSRQAV